MDTFGLPLVEAVVNKNKEKINLIIDRYVTHQRTTAYRQEEEFIQATLIEKGLLCIKRRLEAIASLDKPNKYTPLIRDEFTEYLMGTGSEISSDFLLDTETPTEKLLHLSSLRTPITKSTLREILGIFRILDTLKFKSLPTELVSETLPPTNGSEILHEDEYPLSISENERLKLKLYKNRILIWKNIQCGENGKAVQYHRQETEEFPLVATTEVLIFKNCNIGLRRLLSKFQKPHFYKLNNIRFIECFFLFDVTELQEYIPKYNYADMTFSFIHCADTKSGGCYIKNSPHKSFDTAMLLEEDKNKPSAIIQMQINRLNIKSFLGKIEFVPLPCFGLASSVGIKSNTVEATSSSSSPAERLERKS